MPIIPKEAIRGQGPPRARYIRLHPSLSLARPEFVERGYQAPGRFRFVSTNEERSVAEHGIENQSLVGLGRIGAEGSAVLEMHFDRLSPGLQSRYFGIKQYRRSFVRLDLKHE